MNQARQGTVTENAKAGFARNDSACHGCLSNRLLEDASKVGSRPYQPASIIQTQQVSDQAQAGLFHVQAASAETVLQIMRNELA